MSLLRSPVVRRPNDIVGYISAGAAWPAESERRTRALIIAK
jgi:hypothetical protein